MKYLIIPFWSVMVILILMIEMMYFSIIYIMSILCEFNSKNFLKWSDIFNDKDFFGNIIYYDKNPIETIIRRCTFNDYKNYKND